MGLRNSVKRLALHVPMINRIHAELGGLRSGCRSLQAEVQTLRADNQMLEGQVAGLVGILSERDSQMLQLQAGRSAGAGRANGNAAVAAAAQEKVSPDRLSGCFSTPLVDLASVDPKYTGVRCPEPELNRPKVGVTEVLLSGAEEYFDKFENFSFFFRRLKDEFDALGIEPAGIALDVGSGFGNTAIPLLEYYRNLSVIATDISPDLLVILLREAGKRGIRDRCIAVALDAQRDYFAEGFADIVIGGAVLHHLAEPEALLKTVMRVLKPGGHAIFFEPFETGHSVLRLAYEEILQRAATDNAAGPGFDFLAGLVKDIAVRSHRRGYPGFSETWYDLDDKWLFTCSYFERMRNLIGASSLRIRSLNMPLRPFTMHTRNALAHYAGLTVPSCLPDWAWEVLRRFDEDAFSVDMRSDLVIEGSIVITK